jgi:endoglucanase
LRIVDLIFLLLFQIILFNCSPSNSDEIFIRTNQVGFSPEDFKTAIILSKKKILNQTFSIVDIQSEIEVLKKNISDTLKPYGNFNYCYKIDFSTLKENGNYKIRLDEAESYPFKIGENLFNNVRDSLSLFFKVQRCGPTNPILHQPCHLSDSFKLIGDKDSSAKDLTGGWHDAGDYIKFLKTTAYTTYMLLFSYEFDNNKFSYDLNRNEIPDILEEAKIGIDWLLRCNINNKNLVSQVQDETDHTVGWRLPENDSLQYFRPAFVSIGKNTIGYYSAALALASKIWKEKSYDEQFSKNCLKIAEEFYSIRNSVQDLDTTYSNHYPEKDFNGKLALAAIELYNITLNEDYLDEAYDYGRKAGADYWWSVGDINSLAHYKIAKYDSDFSKYLFQNLKHFAHNSENNIFGEGLDYSWGTTNTFLGISLQAILYKKLTGSSEFDDLAKNHVDYVLGKNQWGISFIYNIGSNFVRNLHSQVAFFNNGYLPGGLSAGPAPTSLLKKYKINRSNLNLIVFNSDSIQYFDDRNDFVCNEPSISSNATALFVFGCFSK